jgi:hypothetical protein
MSDSNASNSFADQLKLIDDLRLVYTVISDVELRSQELLKLGNQLNTLFSDMMTAVDTITLSEQVKLLGEYRKLFQKYSPCGEYAEFIMKIDRRNMAVRINHDW